MTEPREPTAKQWKRRALQAEQQVEFLQGVRASEADQEMRQFRELAALRVALKEAQEILNWALEATDMTDDTQPEAREFTMSQYASKDDMIGAMRKRIAELESELEAVDADRAMRAQAAPAAVAGPSDAVAYIDIGAGGYLDLGSDLSDEALRKLPKGRHMLAIVGTYGVDGYAPVAAPTTQPEQVAQGDALNNTVRVPLDSLHADAAYLIGRLQLDTMDGARVVEIIRERIEAAKAALAAQAQEAAPAAQGDARAEQSLLKVLTAVQRYLPPDGPSAKDTLSEIIGIVDPWPLGDLKGKA